MKRTTILKCFGWVGAAAVTIWICACSHEAVLLRAPTAAIAAPSVSGLPTIKQIGGSSSFVDGLLQKAQVPQSKMAMARTQVLKYLSFVGLDPNNPDDQRDIQRLFYSATAFLFCSDLTDWSCLEGPSLMTPTAKWRQDTNPSLGKPIKLSRSLDYQYFLTQQYIKDANTRDLSTTMVHDLASVIDQPWDQISFAIYGIDDLNDTMKPVYQELLEKRKQGKTVRGVFDVEGFGSKPDSGKLLLTHQGFQPGDAGYTAKEGWSTTAMQYQYDGTPQFLRDLNQGAGNEQNTVARLEWPDQGIMHNKFFVFKGQNKAAVWMGTANVARTCMGDESNANMTLLINDPDVAGIYQTEFNEMFAFNKTPFSDSKKKIFGANGASQIPIGNFHKNKTPNTQRYLIFNDNTEMRIHFSPTDDAEHRVIIPMLLSAQAGDEIRISMFGSGGIELIRALQYAAAQGASVRIVLDNVTSSVPGSWITNSTNITQTNPYKASTSSLEYKRSAWKGLNHHKTATLTRTIGGKKVVMMMIIGSQNWSGSGNDDNDENVVTLRNTVTGIKAGEAFNQHFDSVLWVNTK